MNDRMYLDVDAMREAITNLSPEEKDKVRDVFFYLLTNERWDEIANAIRKYIQEHNGEPCTIRQAMPDILEEEEELLEFLGQFFTPKQ